MTKHGQADRFPSTKLTIKPVRALWPDPPQEGPPSRYSVHGFREPERCWIDHRGGAWYIDRPQKAAEIDAGPYASPESALAALQQLENQRQVVRTCRCRRRTRISTRIDPDAWPVSTTVVIPCAACSGSIHARLEGVFVEASLLPKLSRPRRAN